MPRKQLTQAEKARSDFSDVISSDREVKGEINCILDRLTILCNGNSGDALLCLRNYAQLLIAERQDRMLAETKARIAALESKLGSATIGKAEGK